MLSATVVRVFPFRVDNRTFAYLDNAIASAEAGLSRSFDEVHMCPIIPVMMNVVGDLTEQNSLWS